MSVSGAVATLVVVSFASAVSFLRGLARMELLMALLSLFVLIVCIGGLETEQFAPIKQLPYEFRTAAGEIYRFLSCAAQLIGRLIAWLVTLAGKQGPTGS